MTNHFHVQVKQRGSETEICVSPIAHLAKHWAQRTNRMRLPIVVHTVSFLFFSWRANKLKSTHKVLA